MACSVRCKYSTSMFSIHGPASTSTATAATIFGTKDSVASLICVAAWNTLTSRPTASTVNSTGADTSSSRYRPCWPRVKTWVASMLALLGEGGGERAEQEVPAVGQHEQHQLEGQGDQHR